MRRSSIQGRDRKHTETQPGKAQLRMNSLLCTAQDVTVIGDIVEDDPVSMVQTTV